MLKKSQVEQKTANHHSILYLTCHSVQWGLWDSLYRTYALYSWNSCTQTSGVHKCTQVYTKTRTLLTGVHRGIMVFQQYTHW